MGNSMGSGLRSFFDIRFWKFILVGAANTLVSAVIMFGLYNLLHLGYWGSSAISYVLGSILSFFLNKNFTFGDKGALWKAALKFSATVAVCYVIAYAVAKPAAIWALGGLGLEARLIEQLAMLLGMCLFTALNYVGQRYFAFR